MSTTSNRFGPKPAPTALKKLAGNPGKRALNAREPHPQGGPPPCPDWMPPEGRKQWERVVPELDRLKLLTSVDGAVLEGFCAAYSEFVETVRAGESIKPSLMAQVRYFAGELGLTPAARARLSTPTGQEDEQIEMFFH